MDEHDQSSSDADHPEILGALTRLLNDNQIELSDPFTTFLWDDVRHKLPHKFEWAMIDVNVDKSFAKLNGFISRHYRPGDDRDSIPITMNFYYSHDLLRWLLRAPGALGLLHVAVRDKTTKKLVGFVAGTPAKIRIKSEIRRVVVANLLCVHKAQRSEGLASVLIVELARRATVLSLWQGVYTTEYDVAAALCSCEWLQLILNPKKLHQIGYSVKTSRHMKRQRDNAVTKTIGFRGMERGDVNAVTQLLKDHLAAFALAPVIDEHFVEHFLLPKQDLVESYVVEDPETLEITDFCSFVIKRKEIKRTRQEWLVVKCAVLFYYAATKTSLVNLIGELVGMACRDELDIFRALGIMGNDLFLNELMFKPIPNRETPALDYHLYNYGLRDVVTPKEIGLIIL